MEEEGSNIIGSQSVRCLFRRWEGVSRTLARCDVWEGTLPISRAEGPLSSFFSSSLHVSHTPTKYYYTGSTWAL